MRSFLLTVRKRNITCDGLVCSRAKWNYLLMLVGIRYLLISLGYPLYNDCHEIHLRNH